ncbi:symmetrical bis(5'-nucleosyl)-tetraphosphatase [Glaciecola sp. MH2013]|uniref:symmetrical bis(5'-nucleosyl)-tetraphosphatase n=1 Tax=Glaciecola sp. MH2013 TaxID=2785524 RepID=UPI00189D4AC7|nr:symmetrical bis(5'-nucleosyl)-tetraphosphatase [Glaciecola sp. MH2013]MBF7075083.1 symmetrical bis(5'-nucleosyl)-tetraphosphatase [Glaciecola sp. MH2013]
MNNFVVGDIQGCYKGLKSLLNKARFNPQQDKLWAVGDLIARGPNSLESLKYLYDLGEHFDTVLGNHDLHLIAMAHGIGEPKPADKLTKLMNHKSFPILVDWLMKKPLAIKPSKNILISHAGLYPAWSISKGLALSEDIQATLQSDNALSFLKEMYGNTPDTWSDDLKLKMRRRFVVNAFTRMRYLNGMALEFKTKCAPSLAPQELKPWFDVHNKKLKENKTLIFGHWASLMGKTNKSNIIGLDTGFVWGKEMSLYHIESQQIIRHSA